MPGSSLVVQVEGSVSACLFTNNAGDLTMFLVTVAPFYIPLHICKLPNQSIHSFTLPHGWVLDSTPDTHEISEPKREHQNTI